MAIVNSRASLIEHCLRRLGAPVLEINVDPDQIEDCVDDALQMYQEFHQDGTKRIYLKHLVTAADVANEYIEVSSDIQTIIQLLPVSSSALAGTGMFSLKYQIHLNDIANMNSFMGDMSYYEQIGQFMETLDLVLDGYPQVTFSRQENRLYIHGEWWNNQIKAGDYIVAEVYQIVDPTAHTSIYNDIFIKKYTTALIKSRWGQNMSKFEGMQLPGGVTISGERILGEAQAEIETLEEKLRLEYEPMPMFFVG